MNQVTRLLLVCLMALVITPVIAAEALAEKVFIKAEQVAELVAANAPNLRVIDTRVDVDDYLEGHVPGAIHFSVRKDLRVIGAWETAGVRRQLEDQEELFGRQLGIDSNTMVILYDDSGWDATRLFWELRHAGHENVVIMYGGWPEWDDKEFATEETANVAAPALFVADVQPQYLATASYIMSKMGNPNVVLLDARSVSHFKGDGKHGKAAIGGRMPSAVNAFTLANWEDDTYLMDPNDLADMYADLGVTADKEIIIYCNTGYFAANTFFILKALEFPNVRVYDYSWLEWAGKGFMPKIVGSAE